MGKNPFLDDDEGAGLTPADAPATAETYTGPERRSGRERRQNSERREEFRFEPGKGDRRSGKDRRKRSGWDDTSIR
ncbi:hypothetical protein GCM10028862_05730 [Luteimonas pelagia]